MHFYLHVIILNITLNTNGHFKHQFQGIQFLRVPNLHDVYNKPPKCLLVNWPPDTFKLALLTKN